MDLEQAERFVAAAEEDYSEQLWLYSSAVDTRRDHTGGASAERNNHDALRAARADVLAAQQVLVLARNELRWQEVWAPQAAAEHEKREEGRPR